MNAREFLDSLRAEGHTSFQSEDARVRDEARRTGWSGSLRGPLHFDGSAALPSVPAAIEALVPGARVTPGARVGVVGRVIRTALAGRSDTVDVIVHDPNDGGRFTLRFPQHADLYVEAVARAVDTAIAMRLRFGRAVGHARLVAIDSGPQGFNTGHYAGVAVPTVGDVHLNASLFLAPEHRADRVDGTTAHEFWHQVELGFNARRYRESIDFRRALGAYFGVETLERVVDRPGPAQEQLMAEVSAYAATSALEATAEMARLWWTLGDDPPAVVQHFGAVVDRFFPPPAR
jgi:hypothetical protein